MKKLKSKITDLSFKQGEFSLSSGRKSRFYFDLKPALLDPQTSNLIADAFLSLIHSLKIKQVGGLEIGAIPIVSLLIVKSFLQPPPIRAFYFKKDGSIIGSLQPEETALVDDVATTGSSLLFCYHLLRERKIPVKQQ